MLSAFFLFQSETRVSQGVISVRMGLLDERTEEENEKKESMTKFTFNVVFE